jgi:hypothetical protein
MSSRMAVALIGTILAVGALQAHHNMSAVYDFNNRVSMTGTLTKFDWRNPHIELIIEAQNGKEMETWTLEGPAPNFFRDRDVSKGDFESSFGKPVSFEASRARDGSRSGLLRTMTLPGGKIVSACPQNC